MNRDFFLPTLTPAKARMMVAASRGTNLHLSREIIKKAGEDLLTFADFPGIPLDDMGLSICQFITDYNHRCAFPYDDATDQLFTAIAAMIPRHDKVLFLCDTPVKWVRELREKISRLGDRPDDRCHFIGVRELTPSMAIEARDHYVIANITQEHVGYEWMGKLFPRMIIYSETAKQFTLPFGITQGSTARHAAGFLYPEVVRASTADKNRRGSGNLLPLMGCFSRLVKAKSTSG